MCRTRPRATARRTVAWLTPRLAAASLELINLCKACAEQRIISKLRSSRQLLGLGFREWGRHFVVENVQRTTSPFGDFVPNFLLRSCAHGPSERDIGSG